MFESIINPIFAPLLKLPIFWSIFVISLLISLIITFVYKWMTDQDLMKTLKGDLKKFQAEMKEFKSDPKRVMEIQKRAMETNMKYMGHSLKPTLITFLPLIIIFGWLGSNLAFVPIMPGQEFTTSVMFEKGVTGNIILEVPEQIELLSDVEQEISNGGAVWKLKGEAGEYILDYVYEDEKYHKEVLITTEQKYKEPVEKIKDSKALKTIQINHEKVKPLNIFGWKIGWLGTYIIFSLIFSMTLRKVMKLH